MSKMKTVDDAVELLDQLDSRRREMHLIAFPHLQESSHNRGPSLFSPPGWIFLVIGETCGSSDPSLTIRKPSVPLQAFVHGGAFAPSRLHAHTCEAPAER